MKKQRALKIAQGEKDTLAKAINKWYRKQLKIDKIPKNKPRPYAAAMAKVKGEFKGKIPKGVPPLKHPAFKAAVDNAYKNSVK